MPRSKLVNSNKDTEILREIKKTRKEVNRLGSQIKEEFLASKFHDVGVVFLTLSVALLTFSFSYLQLQLWTLWAKSIFGGIFLFISSVCFILQSSMVTKMHPVRLRAIWTMLKKFPYIVVAVLFSIIAILGLILF